MSDYISRQAAIDAYIKYTIGYLSGSLKRGPFTEILRNLPSAQTEPHYCRECKFSRCHINVDKHGNSETYWRCLNWDGETDEEGYCHEWKRKTDG